MGVLICKNCEEGDRGVHRARQDARLLISTASCATLVAATLTGRSKRNVHGRDVDGEP